MKIEKTGTETTVNTVITYTVDGAEPVSRPFSTMRLVPKSVNIHLRNGELSTVKVSGPRVTKPGEGADAHAEWYPHGLDEAPRWVQDLVTQTLTAPQGGCDGDVVAGYTTDDDGVHLSCRKCAWTKPLGFDPIVPQWHEPVSA